MKNAKYYNENIIPYSWDNLIFIDKNINAITIMDIIEDSKCGKDLVEKLGKLKMVHNRWRIDRETDEKVRIKHIDSLGNISYIECEK